MTHCLGRDSVIRLMLVVFLATATSLAQETQHQAVAFTSADIFLELNDTDGDLGIHSTSDAPPWTEFKIIGPTGLLMDIFTRPELTTQGMNQLAFESAEPSFDELSPRRFFRRFPEGRYALVAHGVNGESIKSYAQLSHILAAPPDNVVVNGLAAADSCDDPPPTVLSPVTIDWDPVTSSHPRVGRRGGIRIKQYQFFVEGGPMKLSVDLPPSVTEFDIPQPVTATAGTYKFEIIAQTTTGNNTAIETCFRVQ